MNDKKSVFGIYKSRQSVESAVDSLKAGGFSSSDISVLMPKSDSTQDFAHEKDTKAPEGATTGGTTGAVVGAGLGWLVGIGALAIPGVGPFIAAGPIMAALAGAGIGGAVGGLTGALVGMGIPEYEAKRYESFVKDGGILLSVHSENSEETERAKKILEQTGAKDIASSSEVKASGSDHNDTTSRPMGTTGSTLGTTGSSMGSSSTSTTVDPTKRY